MKQMQSLGGWEPGQHREEDEPLHPGRVVLADVPQDARLVLVEGALQQDVAQQVARPPNDGLPKMGRGARFEV